MNAWLAGIDEAGRGCLAGPVVAAAVILPVDHGIVGLNDSKKLSASARNALAISIKRVAVAWNVGTASVEEIDRHNILQANFMAMRRAVAGLSVVPTHCLVDGNLDPKLGGIPTECLVGGDALNPSIMAASILAKVTRDQIMAQLHIDYPLYGFAQHKGYGTRAHVLALQQHGVSAVHRRSFSPCRQGHLPGLGQ